MTHIVSFFVRIRLELFRFFLTETVQVAPREYFFFLIHTLIRKIGHLIVFENSNYRQPSQTATMLSEPFGYFSKYLKRS